METAANQQILQRCMSLGREFQRLLDDRNAPDSETADYFKYQIDMLHRHSAFVSDAEEGIHKIISNLKSVYNIICPADGTRRNTMYQARRLLSGDPGRPKIEITQEQLEYFLEKGFSCPNIANMLTVSVRTVRRRMSEYGITSSRSFDNISDDNLLTIIREIRVTWPRSGYRMVQGCLRARGLKIQQLRVRHSLQRLDPLGTVERWRNVIRRRVYSVCGPNALWHIDGNHKLIR